MVFMAVGVFAFFLISDSLGGSEAATQAVLDNAPNLLAREGEIGHLQFLSYCFVPLSVGMFPHLFQHWLTARSAKTFRVTVIAHPIFIMIVWVPCVLIGVWATGMEGFSAPGGNSNAVLYLHLEGGLSSLASRGPSPRSSTCVAKLSLDPTSSVNHIVMQRASRYVAIPAQSVTSRSS